MTVDPATSILQDVARKILGAGVARHLDHASKVSLTDDASSGTPRPEYTVRFSVPAAQPVEVDMAVWLEDHFGPRYQTEEHQGGGGTWRKHVVRVRVLASTAGMASSDTVQQWLVLCGEVLGLVRAIEQAYPQPVYRPVLHTAA